MYGSKFTLIFKHFNSTTDAISVKQQAKENLRTDFNTLSKLVLVYSRMAEFTLHVDRATEQEIHLLRTLSRSSKSRQQLQRTAAPALCTTPAQLQWNPLRRGTSSRVQKHK